MHRIGPAIAVERHGMGRTSLHRLDWDTQFFGACFGTVDTVEVAETAIDRAAAVESLLSTLLTEARADGYAHITYRTGGSDWSAIHGAQRAGFLLVDTGIDLVHRLDRDPRQDSQNSAVRLARNADLPALCDLAGRAFIYSRFFADPYFSLEQVDAFHRQWITNLVGGLAQAVFVYATEDGPIGFISCAREGSHGRIPLMATAADHRRQGVGRTLVEAALRWFCQEGLSPVYVKTQAANIPALALYQRAGFIIDRCEITLSVALMNRQPAKGGLP